MRGIFVAAVLTAALFGFSGALFFGETLEEWL